MVKSSSFKGTRGLFNPDSAREVMVRETIEGRGVKDPMVLQAFRKVPRHRFVEEALQDRAYEDYPLPIGEGQTISQPYIVALMVEALALDASKRVLEIGTGSGYQAAILSRIAKQVFTIERIPSLMIGARRVLHGLEYSNIETKVGDGTLGWLEHAPYDGIIVSAAAPSVPKALLDQLALGGRLVIPVGNEFSQELQLIVKTREGFESKERGGCRFVKLIGTQGWNH